MSWCDRLAWAVLTLLACLAPPVAAEEAESRANGSILLVVDERARALATRVAAELEALGFAVLPGTRSASSEMAGEARQVGAFAAISLGPTAQGDVEITVLDRVTGKTVRRELLGRSLTDPTARELIALRVSELLRASLMEIEAPHPARGDVRASPVVTHIARAPETIRRPERPFRLGAESGILLAPGLSAVPLLQAAFGVRALERLEVTATLGSQLTVGKRLQSAGRIETLARWASVGPKLLILPRLDDASVTLGIDAQVLLLSVSAAGFAESALHRGQSRTAWTAAGSFGMDSRIRVYEQLWWTLRPALGFTTSELALRIDGHDVRVWGRPWLQCSTGLEVEL